MLRKIKINFLYSLVVIFSFLFFGARDAKAVVYLNLDEGYGSSVYDQGGGRVNGSITEATWMSDDWCAIGKCLNFDGSNDVVTVTATSTINLTSKAAYGISAWIYPHSDGEGDLGQMVNKGTNTYIRVSGESGNNLNIDASLDLATTDATVSVTTAIQKNTWSHIVLTYDDDADDEISLYVNGALVGASTNGVGSPATDSNNLLIGGPTTANFDGLIDEVKIYGSAVTVADVTKIYSAGSAGIKSVGNTNTTIGSKSNYWLTNGLVSYWKFDETSGGAQDSAPAGNNLTDVNTVAFARGKFNMGGDFEKNNSEYQYIADNASLSITGSLTISAWIKPESVTAATLFDIVGKWDGTNESYLLAQYGDEIRMYIDSASNYVTTDVTNLATANWYFVTAVYDSSLGQVKIYVNGELQASTITGTIPNSIGDDAGRFQIGAEDSTGGAGSYYDGVVDSVRIHSRALSFNDVVSLYNWAPEPIAYWKFDEKFGSTAQDSSANNYYGSLGGGVSVNTPRWSSGKYGAGLVFDGANDYVTIASNTALTAQSMTVSLWARIDDKAKIGSNNYQTLVETIDPAYLEGYQVLYESSGSTAGSPDRLWLVIYHAATYVSAWFDMSTIPAKKIFFVSATYDGATINIYVNGVKGTAGSYAVTTMAYDSLASTRIGLGVNALSPFKGMIDDVKIYNYIRTSKQMTEDLNASHPIGGSPVASQIGYWNFDRGYGSVANDKSANASNGTITEATWNNSGKFGKCLNFDGTNDVVTVTNNSTITTVGKTGYTISAWVYPHGGGEGGVGQIINKGTNIYMRVSGESGNNLNVDAKMDLGTDATVSVSTAIQKNTWSHIAMTYEDDADDEISIYINGTLRATSTNGVGVPSANTSNVLIGGPTTANFDGLIDEVKLYDGALSAEGIKVEYNQGKSAVLTSNWQTSTSTPSSADYYKYCVPGDTSTCLPPVMEWNFEEKTGTNTYDTSTNGASGSIGTATKIKGKVGNALQFGASGAYVDAGDVTMLDGASALTASFWVYWNSRPTGSNFASLIRKDSSVTLAQAYATDSAWRFILWAPTINRHVVSWNYIPTGRWVHVEEVWGNTYNSGTPKLYVDGRYVADFSLSSTGTTTNSSVVFCLGAKCESSSNSERFDGKIDQVRIYNYVRTPEQIALDYNQSRPLVYWKMDDGSGTVIHDDSGSGYNMTMVNFSSPSTAWVTGKINKALDFDGFDDYATTSANAVIASTSFSVAFWFNADSLSSWSRFIQKANGSSDGFAFRCNNNKINFQVKKYNIASYIESNDTVSTGAWHHAVGVYDGTNIYMYLDGVRQTATGVDEAGDDGGSLVYLGARAGSTGSYPYNGRLDDVRFYGYAMNQTQVLSLYNQGAVSFR